ncbi:hypothetical protein GJ744_004217 [Endocarpon pusillum]|uniref:Ankyrin repeat protein n=1 Tax=Endocarpon pusillum TaxID=364733 RepID=A0A8H7DXP6_9EURO|nr:hypothetical protein GJ744_004217 [Endocarpon pusillum]
MADYKADPRFDAFNAILPYNGEDFNGFCSYPVTAMTPALPDKLGSSQALQADSTALSADVKNQILQIVEVIWNGKNPYEEDDLKDLQNLRTLMENCRHDLQIDVDRITRIAIAKGKLQMLKYLVEECGASLLSRDTRGGTPVINAARQETQNLDSDSDSGGMVLKYIAGKLTDKEVFRTELYHQDLDGKTVLDYAIAVDSPDVVQFCFEHGADPDIIDKPNGSVWDIAWVFNHDASLLVCTLHARIPASLDLPLYFSGVDLRYGPPCIETKVTKGPLIYAVLRHVIEDPLLKYENRHQDVIFDEFLKSFSNSPTVPGDPDLTYREPSCHCSMERHTGDPNRGPSVLSVVFPCLAIQDMSSFEKSRSELKDLRNTIGWSNIGKYFQMTRTLDETYYPSLTRKSLKTRNMHQVVTRECKETINGDKISDTTRPILTVPQFWIWKVGKLVFSAYSPPGKLHSRLKDYEADMSYHSIDKNIGTLSELTDTKSPNAHVAALLIDQIKRFGRTQGINLYQSPLDIFEIGVVRVLSTVDDYMQDDDLAADANMKEKNLVNDIADIRDELAMVDFVLRQQDAVLDSLMKQEKDQDLKNSVLTNLEAAREEIKGYRERVSKIDKDAERVDKTVQDRLNLKRTFASIRDTKASLLLGIAVIGFTVVNILFAPLAFMTALFALNIDELVKHKNGTGGDAVYPSWYIVVTFS